MPKPSKKRKRKNQTSADLFNLTGMGRSEPESVEGLMEEWDTSERDDAKLPPDRTGPANSAPADNPGNSDENSLWDLKTRVVKPTNTGQVNQWNAALAAWLKTGNYSNPALLPNLDVELSRHFGVEKLSKHLLKSSEKAEIRMPTFERWIIDSKLEEETSLDPVLPNVDSSCAASLRLVDELACSNVIDLEAAQDIVQDLCRQTHVAIQEVIAIQRRTASKCPLKKKGSRIEIEERVGDDKMVAILYSRKSWKKPFCIKLNVSHYEKLKTMFEQVHGKLSGKALHSFHLICMCLLLRYSSLSGGQLIHDLRGGGMQGAIHAQVFAALRRSFGEPCLECFASPLNSFYAQFGSAFQDLDWHFGSIGNFFTLNRLSKGGYYEANPPFSPGLMHKMATRMQQMIEIANKKMSALTFCVIVPSTSSSSDTPKPAMDFATQSYNLLEDLSTRKITLAAREHGYVVGAQHARPTRFKVSLYETTVFVLQSVTAQESHVDLNVVEQSVRKAFKCREENQGL